MGNDSDHSVWDWSRRRQLARFPNGNPKRATITSLQIINQDVGGMLLSSSGNTSSLAASVMSLTLCLADGMIRLYRNYDPATSSTDVQMVSAFRGLSEIISMRRGAGVIMDWKQAGGFLLVGGDSRIIRVWDAHTEAQLLVCASPVIESRSRNIPQDLETNSDSPVTAIASERGPSSVLLASFADGVIKVFDRRLEEEDAVVRSFNEHTNWVQNVGWQPHFGNQFLSARSVSYRNCYPDDV